MRPSIMVLKLCLEELGIFDSVKTNSLLLHGAMYLAHQNKVNLSYNFKLYPAGVLSPNLSEDYDELLFEDDVVNDFKLIASLNAQLRETKKMLVVPPQVELSQAQWVQLIAQLKYVLNIGICKNRIEANEYVSKNHSEFKPYCGLAWDCEHAGIYKNVVKYSENDAMRFAQIEQKHMTEWAADQLFTWLQEQLKLAYVNMKKAELNINKHINKEIVESWQKTYEYNKGTFEVIAATLYRFECYCKFELPTGLGTYDAIRAWESWAQKEICPSLGKGEANV